MRGAATPTDCRSSPSSNAIAKHKPNVTAAPDWITVPLDTPFPVDSVPSVFILAILINISGFPDNFFVAIHAPLTPFGAQCQGLFFRCDDHARVSRLRCVHCFNQRLPM